MKKLLLGISMVAASLGANPAQCKDSGMEILAFRLSQFTVIQGSNFVASGLATYNPKIKLGFLSVGADLGGSMLKNRNSELFTVLHAQLLAGLHVSDSMAVEVGGGVQNWLENGGTRPVVSGNLVLMPKSKFLGFIDEWIVGYSGYLISNLYTHETRLGVGIALF